MQTMLLKKLEKKSQIKKKFKKKIPRISKKLNISVTFLKYIEEGKIDKIPDHIPAKGFVKTYAKLLNVNIDDELGIVEQNIHTMDKSLILRKSRLKHAPKSPIFLLLF